jgi:hypothetical protein
MNYKEDLEVLRRADFTEEEIKRLSQSRRDHPRGEEDQPSADYHRLAFVRWLVATGRLSDQLA